MIDLSGATLTVTWRSIGTHQILAVYPDRTVWYWAMATIGPRSADVGSYATEASARQYGALEQVVAQLGNATDRPSPHDLGLAVTFGQRAAWVRDGTDQAGAIAAAVRPLVESALSKPVAVARFAAQVVRAPTGDRVAGFTFASLGREPVQLRFEAESFELTSPSGERLALPVPRMGLVDSNGALLDGLYQTATVPAGGQGACTVVLPGPDDQAAAPPARAAIRGLVLLVGPWPSSANPANSCEAATAPLARNPL